MVIDNQAISKTVDAIKNSEGGRQKIGEKNLQILYLTNQFRQILYFSINICIFPAKSTKLDCDSLKVSTEWTSSFSSTDKMILSLYL